MIGSPNSYIGGPVMIDFAAACGCPAFPALPVYVQFIPCGALGQVNPWIQICFVANNDLGSYCPGTGLSNQAELFTTHFELTGIGPSQGTCYPVSLSGTHTVTAPVPVAMIFGSCTSASVGFTVTQ
jgi:hypothetical protein